MAFVQVLAWRGTDNKPFNDDPVHQRQHIEAETKWTPFRRRHFEVHFIEWKCLNSDWNFIEICSEGFNQQYPSIGSDDGLAPSRRQAIIWTNDGIVYWRIYTSLGLNELTNPNMDK